MRRSVALLMLALSGCDEAFDLVEIHLDGGGGDTVSSGSCPEAFPASRRLYVPMFKNWPSAELHCKALDTVTTDSWHTHLLVVNSSADLEQGNIPALTNTWVGLTDQRRGTGTSILANFDWITGESGLTPWSSSSPEASGSAPYCAYRSSGDGLLHDGSCYTGSAPFVCECDQMQPLAEHIPP
jgi:hypothetical protein